MEEPAQRINGIMRTATDEENNGVRRRINDPDIDDHGFQNTLDKDGKKNKITERIFVPRESPLTELFESNPHLRVVYHLFMVILIMLFLNNMVYDFFDKGEINFGQRLIILGFSQFHIVAIVWTCMQIFAISVLYLIQIWASVRLRKSTEGVLLKAWDILWILIYITGFVLLLALPIYSICHFELPIASSHIISFEMVRLIMKLHSFVRNCAPRILRSKKLGKRDIADSLPKFSHYLYFLFAPTLLYRDSYPRTTHVRKLFVLKNLLEVLGVIFYISFLCDKFILKIWSTYGLREKNVAHLAADIFTSSLPGILAFLSGFYCLLHAWHNAFAEMLRFADRQFYKEWWLSSQFGAYYRTWNAIVYDWLRSHVYNEILPIGGRNLATFAVFAVSALVHELILSLSFRFFYPVLLIMFGALGLLMVPLTQGPGKNFPALGNVGMWLSLVIGNGLLWSMYSMEYFARVNCDTSNNSWWKPVSWTCPGITMKPDWKLTLPFSDEVNFTT